MCIFPSYRNEKILYNWYFNTCTHRTTRNRSVSNRVHAFKNILFLHYPIQGMKIFYQQILMMTAFSNLVNGLGHEKYSVVSSDQVLQGFPSYFLRRIDLAVTKIQQNVSRKIQLQFPQLHQTLTLRVSLHMQVQVLLEKTLNLFFFLIKEY